MLIPDFKCDQFLLVYNVSYDYKSNVHVFINSFAGSVTIIISMSCILYYHSTPNGVHFSLAFETNLDMWYHPIVLSCLISNCVEYWYLNNYSPWLNIGEELFRNKKKIRQSDFFNRWNCADPNQSLQWCISYNLLQIYLYSWNRQCEYHLQFDFTLISTNTKWTIALVWNGQLFSNIHYSMSRDHGFDLCTINIYIVGSMWQIWIEVLTICSIS